MKPYKNSRNYIWIIAGLTLALATTASAKKLTLKNGSFEEILGKLPPGVPMGDWISHESNIYAMYVTATTGRPKQGKNHLLMIAKTRSNENYTSDAIVYQLIGITSDEVTSITFSASFCRRTIKDSKEMTFGLYTDIDGAEPLAEQTIVLTTKSTKHTVTAKNVPEGTPVYAVFNYKTTTPADDAFVDGATLLVE